MMYTFGLNIWDQLSTSFIWGPWTTLLFNTHMYRLDFQLPAVYSNPICLDCRADSVSKVFSSNLENTHKAGQQHIDNPSAPTARWKAETGPPSLGYIMTTVNRICLKQVERWTWYQRLSSELQSVSACTHKIFFLNSVSSLVFLLDSFGLSIFFILFNSSTCI